MALEKYKVMGAMVALENFTAAELATASGVSIDTVRTQLARLGALLEAAPIVTNRPGARTQRYRLLEKKRAELIRQLREVYRAVHVPTVTDDTDREELSARFDALDGLKERLRDAKLPGDERDRLKRIASHHLTSIHDAMSNLGDDAGAAEPRERYRALLQEMNQIIVYLTVAQAPKFAEFVRQTLDASPKVIVETKGSRDKIRDTPGASEVAVVTVDSSAKTRAFSSFTIARKAAAEHPLVVLDVQTNAQLQNAALAAGALYVGGARATSASALFGAIDMAAQVSRANELDDTATRRARTRRRRIGPD